VPAAKKYFIYSIPIDKYSTMLRQNVTFFYFFNFFAPQNN